MSNLRSRQFWFDLAERVLWTALQAALGLLSVELFDLPQWAALPVAAGLAFVKGWVARRIGALDTAATLPARLDPAAPPPNPPAKTEA